MALVPYARGLLLLTLASVLGCDSGSDLNYRGRRLVADGDYEPLVMFGDGRDDVVLAKDHAHDSQLAILPFGSTAPALRGGAPFEGKPCVAGAAANYFAVRTDDGQIIGLYATNEPPHRLRFVDAHCNAPLADIDDVTDDTLVKGGFLVLIDGGRLLFADPFHGHMHAISEHVDAVGSGADVATTSTAPTTPADWLLEGKSLVLRSESDGTVLRRAGHDVSEIAISRRRDSMLFSDRDATYRLGHEGYAPQRIAGASCNLHYETGVRGAQTFGLAMMLAPCASGHLISVDFDGKSHAFADHVTSYFRRVFIDEDGRPEAWTFYTTQDDKDAPEHSFMASPNADAEPIEIGVPIASRSTLLPLQLRDGAARAWLMTTSDDDARGGVFSQDTGFVEAVRGVQNVAISRAGLLVLHRTGDEDYATLSVVSDTGAAHSIAQRVPAQGLFASGEPGVDTLIAGASALREAAVVLHDYDGQTGTLSRIEDDASLVELGRGVPAWSPRSYLTQIRGADLLESTHELAVLSYLRNYDDKTHSGTLVVVDSNERHVVIDAHVSTHVSSADPIAEASSTPQPAMRHRYGSCSNEVARRVRGVRGGVVRELAARACARRYRPGAGRGRGASRTCSHTRARTNRDIRVRARTQVRCDRAHESARACR